MDRGQLLTPTSAAEKYGLKRQKIYYWIRYDKFKYIKLEKSIMFWEKDFLDFLARNTRPAGGVENAL